MATRRVQALGLLVQRIRPYPMRPTLHVLCGLAGAGKSTLAARMALELPALHVHADAIRTHGVAPRTVFRGIHEATFVELHSGRSVVFDTRALHAFERARLISIAHRAGARRELWLVATPWRVCRRRDLARIQPSGAQWIDALRLYELAARAAQCEDWDVVHTLDCSGVK